MAKTLEFVIERVENILEKGENARYQHFLLLLKMFSKALFLGLVKTGDSVITKHIRTYNMAFSNQEVDKMVF